MAKRKSPIKRRASKKSTKKSSSSRIGPRKTAAHKHNEKIIITAIISIVILGLIVWLSQDFPAQGQAYRVNLELEEQNERIHTVFSSCQNGCEYVENIIELGVEQLEIKGVGQVSTYELSFYDMKGKEIQGTSTGNLKADGVVTVQYQGTRYPVSSISVK